jgi:hypothetical protein
MATRRRASIPDDDTQEQIEALKKAVGRPNAKWLTLGLALLGLAATPSGLEVIKAWHAPPVVTPVVSEIEWKAAEDRADRIESKLDRVLEAQEADRKLRDDQIDQIRTALDRITPSNRTRLPR